MADSKLSALSAVTTPTSGDHLLVAQGGVSMKMDLATLFQKAPSRIQVVEASESPASGAIATNLLSTKVGATTAGAAYTLAAGTHGMEKFIVCSSAEVTTPTAVITVTGGSGFTTITFDAVGDTVHLKNIDGSWYVVGQNSVVLG